MGGFGFMSSGADGFKPAAPSGGNNNWGFQPSLSSGPFGNSPGAQLESEEYLDDEERDRVLKVLEEQEERKRALFEKQQKEEEQKRERKTKGREEILKWTAQR